MAYSPTTKNGYSMYEMASMLQKAIRRCDVPHAAYAANELAPAYRGYLWKRLYTVSAEDCYGIMTQEVVALHQADQYVNAKAKPGQTNDLFIAKAVVLLCMARKNRDADYVACNFMWGDRPLTDEEYDQFVDYEIVEHLKSVSHFDIPPYVFDVHTYKGKARGATQMDFFRDENEALQPKQLNLFDNGDFGGWYGRKREQGKLSPSDERRLAVFQSGKDGTDPTHNGTVWPPDKVNP